MSFLDNDTGAGYGVMGTSVNGSGVRGQSDAGQGVHGTASQGPGVRGESRRGHGVHGSSTSKHSSGVLGQHDAEGNGITGTSKGEGKGVYGESKPANDRTGSGVFGFADPTGIGVTGYSPEGQGVVGYSDIGIGVFGKSSSGESAVSGVQEKDGIGVRGICDQGTGVMGTSVDGVGIHARSTGGIGVVAESNGGSAISATSKSISPALVVTSKGKIFPTAIDASSLNPTGTGISGSGDALGVQGNGEGVLSTGVRGRGDFCGVMGVAINTGGTGVIGSGKSDRTGVLGLSESGAGVFAHSEDGAGILATSAHSSNIGPFGFAGSFVGAVNVTGPVYKSGGGFRIDHPLSPTTMYLNHSFVESPERKNLYDGIVTLDRGGRATVKLPRWFHELNEEFRYSLTPLGKSAPELHIATEIKQGVFRIAGGVPGMRVSWQVTGVRRDPWAKANQFIVEEKKARSEQGKFRHPEVYGKPDDRAIHWQCCPEVLKILKKQRRGNRSLLETYGAVIRDLTATLSEKKEGRQVTTPLGKKMQKPGRRNV